jgi:N-acetylglucosaminyl-diphospho-decaprenol L-rhamnosyltransferase
MLTMADPLVFRPWSVSALAVPAALDTVIVSYRCEGLLRDCLRSLRDHPPSRPMTVHVVDNASGDGTAEMAAREFPEVELTVADRNLGFGAANNVGIREVHGTYVLMLNPDTRITSGALDGLLERMDSRPEVGLCGPRLVREDGTLDHACRRSFPTPLSALGHFTGLGRRRGAKGALAAYRAPDVDSGPVDAVNGAFMLARRAALEEVGLFDEGYWMYMEDLDLCYRLKQAGWTTRYEPSVTVIHIKAGTSGTNRAPRLNYAFHYGMYRFYRQHYALRRSALFNISVYAGICLKLCISTVRNGLANAARGR